VLVKLSFDLFQVLIYAHFSKPKKEFDGEISPTTVSPVSSWDAKTLSRHQNFGNYDDVGLDGEILFCTLLFLK